MYVDVYHVSFEEGCDVLYSIAGIIPSLVDVGGVSWVGIRVVHVDGGNTVCWQCYEGFGVSSTASRPEIRESTTFSYIDKFRRDEEKC